MKKSNNKNGPDFHDFGPDNLKLSSKATDFREIYRVSMFLFLIII
jgi:hypothetical protein